MGLSLHIVKRLWYLPGTILEAGLFVMALLLATLMLVILWVVAMLSWIILTPVVWLSKVLLDDAK
jgi:hypothetical protein